MVIESLPTPQLSVAVPSFPPVIEGIAVFNVAGMAEIVVKVVDD